MSGVTPEGRVKTVIKQALKEKGYFWFMPRGTALGTSGIPDIVCCIKGRFVAIECKAGGGRATGLQIATMQKIEDAGGICTIFRGTTIMEAKDAVEELEVRL